VGSVEKEGFRESKAGSGERRGREVARYDSLLMFGRGAGEVRPGS
jgi:hypothetical protein